MRAATLLREVLPARPRRGWRMAIALPALVAVAAGAVELGHTALAAVRPMAREASAEVLRFALEMVAADGGYPAAAGCEHGGALVAAVAFGAGIVVLGVLIGAAIAGGRCQCSGGGPGDDGDGDGGDELELEPLLKDLERIAIIKVPRQDAPGAPATPSKDTN